MWGTWWVWDARLTSELILLFLYIGFIALQSAIDDPRRADKAGAVLALVGVVNVPIIYFSVKWWNTLHQGASVSLTKSPSMHLAHLGVAAFIVGVSLVKGYEVECDVKMAEGDTTEVAGYQFKFQGIRTIQGPNYQAQQGEVEVFRNGTMVAQLRPEKRNYASSAMPMTEASIDAGLLRDVYVSLGEPIDKSQPEGAWAVRVYYKPFVDWIWAGCVLMALGGLVAVSDRRYRNRRSPRTTA